MVANKNPKIIEGGQRLIVMDIIDPDQASKYGVIDDDVDASDKEDESGFVDAGVITGVTQAEI